MKAHVDLSIFASPTVSFGVASGDLAFEVLPRVGEIVSFGQPIADSTTVLPALARFSFQLKVERVIHAPAGGSFGVMLLLEDAVLESTAQAEALAGFLERGFGLGVDRFLP